MMVESDPRGLEETMNRGAVDHLVVAIMAGVTFVNLVISQLPPVKDNFRAKKAVKVCEVEFLARDCERYVELLSKSEVLELIKDDKMPVEIKNYGYIYKKDGVELAGR